MMTDTDRQKISAHYEEFFRKKNPRAQKVAGLRAQIKRLEAEIASLEDEHNATIMQVGACTDLTRFHLALNHGDMEAAKQLIISAAKAQTEVFEDDSRYWLELVSENELKVCFGRDDEYKDTVVLEDIDTWGDVWTELYLGDDWIRPRKHVVAYFEDKYNINGAYRLCLEKIDLCCSKV